MNITLAGTILSSIPFLASPVQGQAKESSTPFSRPQYQMEAELDQQQHRISATEKVSFKNKYAQPLNDVVFHLYPDSYNELETMNWSVGPYLPTPELMEKEMKKNPTLKMEDFFGDIEIKSVTIQGKEVAYTQKDQVLKIQLDQAIQPDQQMEVTIDFEVKIPYGYQRLNYQDDFYSLCKWYPILSVYDPKTKKWDENPYHIYGESDYSEFSDYQMQLTVPKDTVVAATGTEKESIQENKKVVQVDASNVREFVFFASPHYQKVTRKIEGITVNNYFDKRNPNAKKIALEGLNHMEKVLPFYNQKFGRYAYPEFDIMETRLAGASEYPNIVDLGEYSDERGMNEAIDHELAHQWFYGMVGNDSYSNSALDEGFASFAEQYFQAYASKNDEDFLKIDEQGFRSVFSDPTAASNLPLDQYPSFQAFKNGAYGKGRIALVDLYHKVGEQKFDQIMKTFVSQNKFTNATFSNFFDAVNKIAGKDVRDYMENAFTKPGYYPVHLIKQNK